jgi:hypothetical protein
MQTSRNWYWIGNISCSSRVMMLIYWMKQRQNCLEGNAKNTEYITVSQTDCRTNHNIKVINVLKVMWSSSTREQTKQIKIAHTDSNTRSNSGNAFYHSVQNLFPSCMLSQNMKFKIYRTMTLPVVFCEHELGLSHFRKNTGWGVWKLGTEDI